MKFKLEQYNRNTPDEEPINDVIVVSKKTGRHTVTMAETWHGENNNGYS
ncbi:hypothetical protein [uncultured Gammaproteobacteria bacterium]|jgi:hypothetical protein|nr:hypothetical protein [uncultured Gammaproteobacteria bacterium]CAC9959213.1 hypothetical protein [uncultured Gammaproteobacteria bacterium]CAC9960969.1 hypothetical protein [uncultured Gammaproteobacteria bacterium]